MSQRFTTTSRKLAAYLAGNTHKRHGGRGAAKRASARAERRHAAIGLREWLAAADRASLAYTR